MAKTETWENEGGTVSPASPPKSADAVALSLGVVRQMTETYSVGVYHYTNLTDAIAQARRMTKLERELL